MVWAGHEFVVACMCSMAPLLSQGYSPADTRDFAIAWRASLQRSATIYKTAIEVLEY